ncbi:hypothetical protein VTL71DRAFT_13246 [Oculimacula yallundae]|uniref:MT-A70-domain-containing protein n=1 Tax=Oculimacula yallundae TaxID=86028 RepID=A0ABR4CJT7_9HELO
MDHGIIHQNPTSTILLVDIPHSIEAAQYLSSDHKLPSRRLISSKPLSHPYPSLEPKSQKAKAAIKPLSLQELLLVKHLEFALREVKEGWKGEWCLPRVIEDGSSSLEQGVQERSRKRMKLDQEPDEAIQNTDRPSPFYSRRNTLDHNHDTEAPGLFYSNPTSEMQSIQFPSAETIFYIPPHSTFLSGLIPQSLPTLLTPISTPPRFNLITLDPPWPNRSARRKASYNLSSSPVQIRDLLSSIPIHDLLAEDGLVAIWITNRDSFREMVIGEGGLFEEWDVRSIEEWVWLKVTGEGEPICGLDGTWRKPWEVCRVGRRRKRDEKVWSQGEWDGDVNGDIKRRVIIGVPDLHSRKPNLRFLFKKVMGNGMGTEIDENGGDGKEYEALEIFARNLTAGWWSWGNEVLKFQNEECWIDGQMDEQIAHIT